MSAGVVQSRFGASRRCSRRRLKKESRWFGGFEVRQEYPKWERSRSPWRLRFKRSKSDSLLG